MAASVKKSFSIIALYVLTVSLALITWANAMETTKENNDQITDRKFIEQNEDYH